MSRSAYTLEVGPLFGSEEEREVTLLHQGRPCFSTTHAGILSVLIARFPHLGVTSSRSVPFETPVKRACPSSFACSKTEEYLCVFHKDELHNPHEGPIQGSRSRTIVCTCYQAATTTHYQLPLPDFSPKSFTSGVYGVFIHGYYTAAVEQLMVPREVRIDGAVYHAAADLWWMPSPLVAKPVYVFARQDEDGMEMGDVGIIPRAQSAFERLNATVLNQFVALGTEVWSLTLSGSELGLSRMYHHLPFDAALWRWLPQRLHLAGPPPKSHVLTATVSEHPELEEQIIFLHNSQTHIIQVLKTPKLSTCEGPFTILFTLSGCIQIPSIVLPCVDPQTPQPILVSSYPSNNVVSLFDVPTLIDPSRASPQAYLASTTIHASSHLFNTLTAQWSGDEARDGAAKPPLSLNRECRTIDGILDGESSASSVVFSVSPARSYDGAGEPAAARRRFDPGSTRQSVTINFPTFAHDRPPLLSYLLDVVRITLGTRAAWEVEYAALGEAWRKMGGKKPSSMLSLVQEAVLSRVQLSLYCPDTSAPRDESKCDAAQGNPVQSLEDLAGFDGLGAFSYLCDPMTLSCDKVEKLCGDGTSAAGIAFSSNGSERWAPEACGLLLVVMHLLYESCKIQESLWFILEAVGKFNLQLSILLQWSSYMSFYIDELVASAGEMQPPPIAPKIPKIPSVAESLRWGNAHNAFVSSFREAENDSEPLDLLTLLKNMVLSRRFGMVLGDDEAAMPSTAAVWRHINGLPRTHPITTASHIYELYTLVFLGDDKAEDEEAIELPWWRRLIRYLQVLELSPAFVTENLSLGVAYPILQAIQIGKSQVGEDCTEEELVAIGRIDRLSSGALQGMLSDSGTEVIRLAEERAVSKQHKQVIDDDDGVNMPPDFPQTWMDTRLERAQGLMNTTSYIPLSDSDVKTSDKSTIDTLGWRACATTVGRGILTMATHDFKSCDSIPIPKLNLNGMTETGIIVPSKLEQANREEVTLWPLFHNSCAAGLRFFPLPFPCPPGKESDNAGSSEIPVVSREKLIYQWRSVSTAARAGLLLAAGLLGHFQSLQLTDVYTILVSQELNHDLREITAISVLLGLSSSYRGTNNSTVFKCLSVHILSLTPSDEDVEIRLNVQTAAFVSVGLLCQGQYILSNAFLLEVFLVEMTRLPSDEHCINREGYTLGAAFGLGLVLLGSGRSSGAAQLTEKLIKVMEGAPRESATSTIPAYEYFSEKCFHSRLAEQTDELIRNGLPSFSQCSRVHEGDHYNALVAGPAAVMALGLIFLKTEDELLAQKVAPPDNLKALNGVSPTMCLLRSLVTPLVHWSRIEPSKDWVYRQVPSTLNALFIDQKRQGTFRQQRQYLMMSWGHCIAGTLFALSLRYAGTMNPQARDTIVAELRGFLNHQIGSSGVPMTVTQKSTGAFENCISTCCIAASVVMAGTGDNALFNLFQKLYKRTNVSYGAYMAISMSIGLLFLGGGRLTLSNSTESVAALLISLYPIWPSDVKDNVKHLQALRHLYSLAVVPRVIEAVDVRSQRSVSVPIRIVLRKESNVQRNDNHDALKKTRGPLVGPANYRWSVEKYKTNKTEGIPSREIWTTTACLYPPPDMIDRIDVCSLHHYGISITHDREGISNHGIRLRLLEKSVDDTDAFSAAIFAQDSHKLHSHQHHTVERRLLDWVKRLFIQPATAITESTTILNNVKLLCASQQVLLEDVAACEAPSLLSLDFCRAVDVTLGNRYSSLFAHGSISHIAEHPLHMLIVQKLSLAKVVECVVQRGPKGSRGFPCDFKHFFSFHGAGSPSENTIRQLYHWFRETLCYYDLTPRNIHVVAQCVQMDAQLFSSSLPEKRMLALLRLQRRVDLPYEVLRSIITCCFGAVKG